MKVQSSISSSRTQVIYSDMQFKAQKSQEQFRGPIPKTQDWRSLNMQTS